MDTHEYLKSLNHDQLVYAINYANEILTEMNKKELVPLWLVSNKEYGFNLKAFTIENKSDAFKYAAEFIMNCENDDIDPADYRNVSVSVDLIKVRENEVDCYLKLDGVR